MIRRSAIAGGALLWATPVVQSLGHDSAYAWFRGSKSPGGCRCNEQVVSVVPIACHADAGTKHRILRSGKYVTLQANMVDSCGNGGSHCQPESQEIVWTQVAALGCELVSQTGDTCVVHVTAYPASITLQVTATLTCATAEGRSTTTCSDTKIRRVCFTQVTGSESQRCGRFEPHRNKTHGTQRCS
jgi:hypothetical protein